MIRLWSWSVYFSPFGVTFTLWNGSNLRFLGISRRTHVGNGLKFCLLMYPDHLQNWLGYSHGPLIFLIMVLFWLSETGQIEGFQAFPREYIEGMALNFYMLMYPDHLQNWLDYGHDLLIFLLLAPLWLIETGDIWGFHCLENAWEWMSRGERRHISDALHRVLSSFLLFSLYFCNQFREASTPVPIPELSWGIPTYSNDYT